MQAVAQGAQVHALSSLNREGLQAVLDCLKPGITACLIGSSGAGKTTLLNALCGTQALTREIREDDGKGRHATTARSLHVLSQGGMLIDTPGLREIGLLEEAGMTMTFSEIADFSAGCKFADCTHQVEPGCAVLAAVADGRISQERYASFLKLNRELGYLEAKNSAAGRQEAKKKQKQLGKLIKQYHRINPE
jgi:ribosome biogenesis GTPase